jgi:hypothetical protein
LQHGALQGHISQDLVPRVGCRQQHKQQWSSRQTNTYFR